MADFFANLIDSLMRLLGLKKGDKQKMRALIDEWKQKRRTLHDEVDSLKSDIRELEGYVRAKSKELEQTRGETKGIVEEEIKSILRKLDLKQRKRDVIFGGIDRIDTMIEQAENTATAEGTTVSADAVRELQMKLQLVLTDLKEADREVSKLNDIQYRRQVAEPQNYEQRKAEITAAEPAATTAATTTAPPAEQKSGLSDAERERMARIMQDTN
jgi:hypothetical protein